MRKTYSAALSSGQSTLVSRSLLIILAALIPPALSGCSTPSPRDRSDLQKADTTIVDQPVTDLFDELASSPQGVWISSVKVQDGVMHFRNEYCYSGTCYIEENIGSANPHRISGDPQLKRRYLAEQKDRALKSRKELKKL